MPDTVDTADALFTPPADDPPSDPKPSTRTRKRGARKASPQRDRKADASPTSARRPGRRSNDEILTEKVADLYALVGTLVAIAQPEDGLEVVARAEVLAASWVKLANENPRVRVMLERLLTTSAVGGVVASHVALGVAIARNHGALPSAPAGVSGAPAGAEDMPSFLAHIDMDAAAKLFGDAQAAQEAASAVNGNGGG